jgi:hypothetical protein
VCRRDGRKRWGTRKIKGRAKTSQLQDEVPEWVDRGHRMTNTEKHRWERAGQPLPT